MTTEFAKRWPLPVLGILMMVLYLVPIKQATAATAGQEIFQSKCAACHTIGKGKLVGPDLAGVTARREAGWLKRQIKEPDRLIEEKDPIALQLLQEAEDVEMPPPEISDEEVMAVIAYLKSTEKLKNVVVGVPSQYMPTIIISIIALFILTIIGLMVGRKKVDVR
jgi:mono/diheme cytochrome c family protein|tara:strand:- start:431 stop:925 length:495 start_codon:yes stop_codon:yes gene_type:complete